MPWKFTFLLSLSGPNLIPWPADKIIVIFTRICVFVNKLVKIISDITYGPTDRISSSNSPTILLLYWIPLIFQILVCPRQKSSNYWPIARNWKATSAFCVTDLLILDIFLICKIWLVAQNISSHLSSLTQKSRIFTLIYSLCLLPHNLLSFGSLGIKINKSKSEAFAAQSTYNFHTQETINILKTM
jgi:hypothetical protein